MAEDTPAQDASQQQGAQQEEGEALEQEVKEIEDTVTTIPTRRITYGIVAVMQSIASIC